MPGTNKSMDLRGKSLQSNACNNPITSVSELMLEN